MNSDTPTDRALPAEAMNDRAIAVSDQPGKTSYEVHGAIPHRLNRRARRHQAAEMGRRDRRYFRKLLREGSHEL